MTLGFPFWALGSSPYFPSSILSVKGSAFLPQSLLPAWYSWEVQLLPFIPFSPGCLGFAKVTLPAFVGFL